MDAVTPGDAAGATFTAPAAPTPDQRIVRRGKRPHEVETIRYGFPEAWLECTCGLRLDARSSLQLERAYQLHTGVGGTAASPYRKHQVND